MSRLRVGIVGGGLITQVEHLPNLLALHDRFEVAGVADPSAKVRAHLAARWKVATTPSPEALFDSGLEAVVIAAPDPLHAGLVTAALDRGLHVFVEKPLCYAVAEADAIARTRDRAGRVVQVGYMKRFDPAYEALAARLCGQGKRLRYLSVEVNDPDAAPFTAHCDIVAGDDLPATLIAATTKTRAAQIRFALGTEPTAGQLRGFAGPYCSSLVHDVNLVHGLLAKMGVETGAVVGAAWFANAAGGHGAVKLTGTDAIWSMAHVTVPAVADYLERVSVWLDDRLYELQFPAPYLNHMPTLLLEKKSEGGRTETITHRLSYREAFVEEMKGWWEAIVQGTPVRNTVEDACRDMALLAALGQRAMASDGDQTEV
jgi:predicted dehydrogenase